MLTPLDVGYDSEVYVDPQRTHVVKCYSNGLTLEQLREYHDIQTRVANIINQLNILADVGDSMGNVYKGASLSVIPLGEQYIDVSQALAYPTSRVPFVAGVSKPEFHTPVSTLLTQGITEFGLEPKVSGLIENNFHWKNVKFQSESSSFIITDIGGSIQKLLSMKGIFGF